MEQRVNIQKLEPRITEKRLWNLHNLFLVFFIGVGLILLTVIMIVVWNLELKDALILAVGIIVIYAAILFFLLEPRILKQVQETVVQTVEKPVIKEIPVEIEKEVIVEKPMVRHVYVSAPQTRKKLDIPKYAFVASSETKTYHTRNCRLGKLIKRKYKLSTNNKSDFIKRKYKPCQVCITKQKKV